MPIDKNFSLFLIVSLIFQGNALVVTRTYRLFYAPEPSANQSSALQVGRVMTCADKFITNNNGMESYFQYDFTSGVCALGTVNRLLVTLEPTNSSNTRIMGTPDLYLIGEI